jgi:hypothetical protein
MSKCVSCDKQASLNLPNNSPKYCKDHKTVGMVNVTHKKCIHDKRKQVCIICNSSAFCTHKRELRKCIECNGSGICEHKKRKWDCKLCKGASFCIHNKYKFYCIECNGSGICEHKKRKNDCIECNGSGICIHNIQKRYCKECDGSSICIHNKVKYKCIECNNGKLYIHIKCIHNIQKRNCITCDGSSICSHKKRKTHCKICGGSSLCKTPHCETTKIIKYDGHCAFCYYNLFPDKPNARNYKTKERSVTEFILNTFPEYTWITDKKVEDGCSLRRPDLLLDLGYQVIIVEIDETQHKSYEEICNNRRTMEISKDLNHRPIIFIRFNPDAYSDKDNKQINSCWKINKSDGLCSLNKNKKNEWSNRLDKLKLSIEFWCDENNKSEKTIEVEHLFFDECSNDNEVEISDIEESNVNILH